MNFHSSNTSSGWKSKLRPIGCLSTSPFSSIHTLYLPIIASIDCLLSSHLQYSVLCLRRLLPPACDAGITRQRGDSPECLLVSCLHYTRSACRDDSRININE